MIKTYKQWMQTMYESVQALNENEKFSQAAKEVETLYDAYRSLLDSCIAVGDAAEFSSQFTAMAAGVLAGDRQAETFDMYSSGDDFDYLKDVIERDGKPEMMTAGGAFRYLKLDKGVSTNVTLPSAPKSFAMKNASGNYVSVIEKAFPTGVNFAGKKNAKGDMLYDIKGVLWNINMYNLEKGFEKIKNQMSAGPKNMQIKRAKMGMASYTQSGCRTGMVVLKSVKNVLQIEKLSKVNSIDGVTRADVAKSTKQNPGYDDMQSVTQVIPLYVTTGYEAAGGNPIDASKMVPKTITTVIKGKVTTKENAIPGGDDLFQQGSASPKGDILAGLKSELGKMVEQYDGIKSIVVTGGASFEWQGGERNDAENRKLSESRAQSIAGILKKLYPKIAGVITTAGAEKAKIQPDEDKTKVEEYRKVYIQITGHNIGDDTQKVTSFEEIKNSTWNKDKWTIKCYWMAVTMTNQNVVTKAEYENDPGTYGKKASDGYGKYKVVG